LATATGWWTLRGGDPIPGTEPISIGTPKRDQPLDYVSGSPTLTADFRDKNLNLVKESTVTVPEFNHATSGSAWKLVTNITEGLQAAARSTTSVGHGCGRVHSCISNQC